jgi:hypothetical protein
MNHPKREEWIRLLCGEAEGETKQRLEAHLQSCPACSREVNAWRRTMGRLDAWKLPKARRTRRLPFQPLMWAAAAAIVIGAFIGGRLTAPGVDTQQLRAELKSELSAEIQQGFARVSDNSATALAHLEARLASATMQENQSLARQFVKYIEAYRAEDQQATEMLWEKLQTQYTADFVLLRRDLETLASTTDEEMESARQKLYQLAAYKNP